MAEQYFVYKEDSTRTDLDERDGSWTPYPMARPLRPSLQSPTLGALCVLARIFRDINVLNEDQTGPVASQEDLTARISLFRRLSSWNGDLDPRLRAGSDSMAHIYHLKLVFYIPLMFLHSLPLLEGILMSGS